MTQLSNPKSLKKNSFSPLSFREKIRAGGVADAHQHCRCPSALQMPSGVADPHLSHTKGRSSLAHATHFPLAKLPSRWPHHPASAANLSIRSINKRLFLNSVNLLFFFSSCDCCWISSIFVPSGKRGSLLLQYLIPHPLKHSNGLDQHPAAA